VTRRLALCAFALLILFSSFQPSLAQMATTSLRGSIKDPSGAVVPGASITLTDSATGKVLQTSSGGNGDYQFNQIPPAKYTIKVTAQDLQSSPKLLNCW